MALIRVYQLTVSKLLGPVCRFYPSCSHYGYEAFRRHGTLRGGWLTVRRLLRCHPWNPGGLDPVPERTGRFRIPDHEPAVPEEAAPDAETAPDQSRQGAAR